MVHTNPPPKYPKPLYFPNGRKPTAEERQEHIVYSIEFYNERLAELMDHKPLLLRKNWENDVEEVKKKISDLEYQLFKYTQPEIFNEVEDIGKNNV